MAKFIIEQDQDQMVAEFPPIKLIDGRMTEQNAASLTRAFRALVEKLNGKISFVGNGGNGVQGNVDQQIVYVTAPASANTDFTVPHGLERRAVGVEVAYKDRAADVYAPSTGSWTESQIVVRCTVASAVLRLRIY